jgi:mRNA-degrading endonuclease RelE of RelBE toxin-antitoxin system
MSYEVRFSSAAAKDVDNLPPHVQDVIESKHVLRIAADPRGVAEEPAWRSERSMGLSLWQKAGV